MTFANIRPCIPEMEEKLLVYDHGHKNIPKTECLRQLTAGKSYRHENNA